MGGMTSFELSLGNDRFADFSPDGNWIAYTSEEFVFPDCDVGLTDTSVPMASIPTVTPS